jgi:protein TonB
MPRDLFGDVTRPSISLGNRKWYTVPVSLLSHSAIVAAIVALPILAPALMPQVDAGTVFMPITPVIPPTPPLPAKPVPPQPISNPNAAPTSAPDGIVPEPDKEPAIQPGFEGTGPVVGDAFNFDSQVGGGPPPLPDPPKPVRVGGVIRRPQIVHQVDPVYPPMALAARVEGIVIIEATISAEGAIMDARILRSAHLLDQAALDAVRQWRYEPSRLNGVAVPVIMTVTVAFTLK